MDEPDDGLRTWLPELMRMLAPLAPRALELRDAAEPADELAPLHGPAPGRLLAATGEGVDAGPGWAMRLPPNRLCTHPLLVLRSDAPRELDDPRLVLGRLLARAAWRFAWPAPTGSYARDETRQALHDLRNGLNSVLMAAAVVGSSRLPESAQPFMQDLESAGRRSLRALAELGTLIAPP